MATELRLRRGTTDEHGNFIGAEAEATVDTDKNTIVVHDGQTQGGFPLLKEESLGTSPADVPTNSDLRVDTLPDLQALDTNNARSVYMLGRSSIGDGGEGHFRWDSSDLSTEVGNDEVTTDEGDGGIYVAPASDKTGTSGAWVRQDVVSVSPEMYGAKGDGSADDSASVQRAVSRGGRVFFNPAGVYLIDGIEVTKDYTKLFGNGCRLIPTSSSAGWALIHVKPDGDLDRLEFLDPIVGVEINEFVIDYDDAADKSSAPFNMIQFSKAERCTGIGNVLSNNFIDGIDTTRGSGIVVRGRSDSVILAQNEIDNTAYHGIGHVNEIIVGDYKTESGSETYIQESEFSGELRPRNTLYHNNLIKNTKRYAFDTHTIDGVCRIEGNRVIDCVALNKDQHGSTHIVDNYVYGAKGDLEDILVWAGWTNVFLEGKVIPEAGYIVRGNEFVNCLGYVYVSRPNVQIVGNVFRQESGASSLSSARISLQNITFPNTSQVASNRLTIENNKFIETTGVLRYIDIPSSTGLNEDILIRNNEFYVSHDNGEVRIINAHTVKRLSLIGNICNVQSDVGPVNFLLLESDDSDVILANANTVKKVPSHVTYLYRVAGSPTNVMFTSNNAPGCTINGTPDVSANNII